MTRLRTVAAVVVGVLLATGLVRGSNGQFGALRSKAKKMLEDTGKKNDVDVEDDTVCVEGALASLDEILPGSAKAFTLAGHFSAATTFSAVGPGLALTGPTVKKDTLDATLTAAPDALPSAAVVRGKGKRGSSADTIVAYVGGSWLIEGTTDNGWRVKLSPASSTKPGVLAFKGEFFEGKAASAFITRDATIHLTPQVSTPATYTLQFKPLNTAGTGDAECDPVMARAHELADKLMKAKNQAEEDKVSAEIDQIQDKIDTCVEKQQANSAKVSARVDAAQKAAEVDAKKFGCQTLELSVARDGAAEGSFSCAVGSPAFTGTMRGTGK